MFSLGFKEINNFSKETGLGKSKAFDKIFSKSFEPVLVLVLEEKIKSFNL
ncbi:Uncharacterised protein [Mesomycoplasma hyorhinis]|nr:Uncharacterised protein [Mesomycoplasma hyorhinis]